MSEQDDDGSNQSGASRGNPYIPPSESPGTAAPSQLSIPLAVLLVAFIVGVFFVNIGLGIGVLLLAIPAYARAVGSSAQRLAEGKSLTIFDRLLGFFGSVAVVVACAFAGCCALFATCTGAIVIVGIPSGGQGDVASFLVPIVAIGGFLFAAISVYRAAWPRRGGR